ncbi:MAG: urease accessory protein UreE [Bacteroidota bacterium]|nr:urease accessory protein UreE [Bacteroidota bacterium]
MVIKQKVGNRHSFDLANRSVDTIDLEWYETNKRIMHKRTRSGRDMVLKFLQQAPALTEGDVLWQDETSIIAVEIKPCEAIILQPATMQQMAAVCYEIGNKHLPLFFNNGELLIPFEEPLFKLLSASGYEPKRESRKLLNALKTTVLPHGGVETKQSLFSKILQMTTSPANV